MGLFGGGGKGGSKTSVTPAKDVEALLRKVVTETGNLPDGEYINHIQQNLNPTQRAALSQLAASPQAQAVAQMYKGRAGTGVDQLKNIGAGYQDVAKGNVTGAGVNDYVNSLMGGALAKTSNASLANASLGGNKSAALRRQAVVGNQRMSAIRDLGREQMLQGLGANTLNGNRVAQLNALGTMGNIAGQNISLAGASADAANQAAQNKLLAGNQIQNANQLQLSNDWQNQMGQNQYGWNQLNNKLNILNEVSPMAGYTSTGSSTGGISKAQQLLGAGLGVAGTIGQAATSGQAQAQNTQSAFNQAGLAAPGGNVSLFNQLKGSQTGNIGGVPVYQQAGTSPSFGSSVGNFFSGLSSMFS